MITHERKAFVRRYGEFAGEEELHSCTLFLLTFLESYPCRLGELEELMLPIRRTRGEKQWVLRELVEIDREN